MIFTVYADKAEEVSKRLDKLAKKAARYNVPFSYTISDEHPETVNVFDDFSHKAGFYKVAAVDFDIACEELIKANGWTVLAKVEHGDKGNVVSRKPAPSGLPPLLIATTAIRIASAPLPSSLRTPRAVLDRSDVLACMTTLESARRLPLSGPK